VHLLPSVNPDGYVLKTRNNANDRDLNRGFPDWADRGPPSLGPVEEHRVRQPEVEAVMRWTLDNAFVLSLGLHDGWTAVIFPWDDSPTCTSTDNAVTVEDSTFYQLAMLYARQHAFMHTGRCPCHPEPLVIGNYRDEENEVVEGGSGDWHYLFTSCLELTVEVSCEKRPPAKSLPLHWDHNCRAIMAMLAAASCGLRGIVVDEAGRAVAGAAVHVLELELELTSSGRGEWWRVAGPGTYTLVAHSHSEWGRLASGPVEVQVAAALGEGPSPAVQLVARLEVEQGFLVSCVLAVSGCRGRGRVTPGPGGAAGAARRHRAGGLAGGRAPGRRRHLLRRGEDGGAGTLYVHCLGSTVEAARTVQCSA
jgi:hypothetical protein